MNSTLTITLKAKEKDRLNQLAVKNGLSLSEFSRNILIELSDEIGEESFSDYEQPALLRDSFEHAIDDYRAGRVSEKL